MVLCIPSPIADGAYDHCTLNHSMFSGNSVNFVNSVHPPTFDQHNARLSQQSFVSVASTCLESARAE
jgi:hypothetical protein